MDWLEFSVTADGEAAKAIIELFNRFGQGGAVIEMPVDCFEYELPSTPLPRRVNVKTYLPLDVTAGGIRRCLEEGLRHLQQIYPLPEPVVRTLAEENWAEAWKQQYHRQHIGQHTVIVPAWEEYTPLPGEAVICLEPGMAFGTGLHPTTRLCLEALEAHLAPGHMVLDVGTGSSVLSIAAAKLGAFSVYALDTDPVAVAVAQENVVRNGVADKVTVRHGSLPSDTSQGWMPSQSDRVPYLLETGQFDLVLVNILAPVIIGLAPALAARLALTGQLIAAGLIESQEGAVVAVLQTEGLFVVERAQVQEWVCLVAQRG